MRADNSHHVIAAARRRSETTQRRAVAALRRMDSAGSAVTFDSVAREAGVSRAWIYTQPDLRAEIDRLRQRGHPTPRPTIPDRQRASEASLRQRLETAIGRARDLEMDNRRLRAALAEALGEKRAHSAQRPTSRLPGTKPAGSELPTAVNPS
jgi:Family of unknown function (DUF6262)